MSKGKTVLYSFVTVIMVILTAIFFLQRTSSFSRGRLRSEYPINLDY
jgi:hypothetical protein